MVKLCLFSHVGRVMLFARQWYKQKFAPPRPGLLDAASLLQQVARNLTRPDDTRDTQACLYL